MAPFGFMSDGLEDTQSFVDQDGDRWHTDEYGDRAYVGLSIMINRKHQRKVIDLIHFVIFIQLMIVAATIFGCCTGQNL